MDHTKFMDLHLPLDDVYRASILGFASQRGLAGHRVGPVSPNLTPKCFPVLPGFGPAAEILFFREKDPKP